MNENKILFFNVQSVPMCIHINYITKILPLVELKKVPGAHSYLAGLMNLNGKTIPIIDLAIYMGLLRSEIYSINIPVLLCEISKKQIGFIVDQVIGLIDFNDSDLQKKENLNGSDLLGRLQ